MIIPINKPAGMTSQSVVARIKRMFREQGKVVKIGHSGTLDPMCTGVLPILTDRDTKLADLLPSDKRYSAGLLLGKETDTEDVTGEVINEYPVTVKEADVTAAASCFVGKILQVPPMYSAIKVGGQRLYDLARAGVTVERKAREITVYSLDVKKGTSEFEYDLDVKCSTGTYIRTLCADIGKKLGCGGCMSYLQRTESNGFKLDNCVTLEELSEAISRGEEWKYSYSCERVFQHLNAVKLDNTAVDYYMNGGIINRQRVYRETGVESGLVRVYSPENAFLGLGLMTEEGLKAEWRSER